MGENGIDVSEVSDGTLASGPYAIRPVAQMNVQVFRIALFAWGWRLQLKDGTFCWGFTRTFRSSVYASLKSAVRNGANVTVTKEKKR